MRSSDGGSAARSGALVILGADHRVPVRARPAFEHIATVADAFCREYLNEEYAERSVMLTAKLARKRPSPLLRGDPRIWASAVIYALGRVNFLSDPSQTPHLPAEQLARLLEVKQTTMAAKGRTVMEVLALDPTDTEFCLPSRLASHPTAWLVSINGLIYDARALPLPIQAECARRGLIPGVLAPVETSDPHVGP